MYINDSIYMSALATSDPLQLQTETRTIISMVSFIIDAAKSENSLLQTNVGRPATFQVARVDCIYIYKLLFGVHLVK